MRRSVLPNLIIVAAPAGRDEEKITDYDKEPHCKKAVE
jgi:hypothetical protein